MVKQRLELRTRSVPGVCAGNSECARYQSCGAGDMVTQGEKCQSCAGNEG